MIHITSILRQHLASSIVSLLSSLQAPGLQQISLASMIIHCKLEEITWDKWSEVDQILNSPAFGSFRNLSFVFWTYSPDTIEMHRCGLMENFSLLLSRQMLQIEFDINDELMLIYWPDI
jgi:hypothetical protein